MALKKAARPIEASPYGALTAPSAIPSSMKASFPARTRVAEAVRPVISSLANFDRAVGGRSNIATEDTSGAESSEERLVGVGE
jgi:hypothetical protein